MQPMRLRSVKRQRDHPCALSQSRQQNPKRSLHYIVPETGSSSVVPLRQTSSAGLLAEFSIVIGQSMARLIAGAKETIADTGNALPDLMRDIAQRLLSHLLELDRQVQEIDNQIQRLARHSSVCKRLEQVPGIGPITATALEATVGDSINEFKNGRQLAAFLGLVPRQHSSGGKERLLGISKRGDGYLRCLLIHGARAGLYHTMRKPDAGTGWLGRLAARRNINVACVAQANKTARIVWALLVHNRDFRSDLAAA